MDLDRVQPEEEVLPEAARGDLGGEVGVGGREHPDVAAPGPGGADPLELPALEHPQQLALLARRHVADLVEKERAAVGELEAADTVGARIGEGALDVAEELALEDALRNAAGVQREEGLRGARRSRMEGARHEALAGAVLASDQHGGVGGPDARDDVENGLHRRRSGDHRRRALVAEDAVFGLEPLPLPDRAAECDLGPERREQARVVPGLLDEIAGALPHRLHGQIHRAPGGHDDHGQARIDLLDAREQVQAFLARRRVPRVVQVDEGRVALPGLEGREHAGGRARGLALDALALQEEAKGFEDVALVVGDQNARPQAVTAACRAQQRAGES